MRRDTTKGRGEGMAFGTLYELLRFQAQNLPEAPAILCPDRKPLTYAELFSLVERTVAQLRGFGVAPNDRIAVVLPNGPEMALAFLSTACAGTSAPLNLSYTADEYEFYLQDLKAKAIILSQGSDSPALQVAERLEIRVLEISSSVDKPAGFFSIVGAPTLSSSGFDHCQGDHCGLVLHTSGTTSRPKLVPLSHKNMCISSENIAMSLNLGIADRCLNVMPLFHIHGLMGALCSSLFAGGSVICTPGFDDGRFFEWVKTLHPTWYTAVPTMHQAILSRASMHEEIIASSPFRVIRSCSASLPPQLKSDLEKAFDTPVVEAYGMTEACHQISMNPLPPCERKPKSVGIPTGTEVAILNDTGELLPSGEVGEIGIKGLNVTGGYENNPTANADSFTNGWFRTGDQGCIDSDGYIFITGRIKEIINRGGEKISPREVDEVFLDHPQVDQAIAFALPHPTLGQDVAVAVVARKGSAVDEEQLREFAFTRLAAFKVPSRVVLVDSIPKGPTGKLQRIGLDQKLAGMLRPVYVAPRNETERVIADIWTRLLKIERIGVKDNFFLMGGDSITAVRFVSEVKTRFGIELPLQSVFRSPTVEQIGRVISQGIEKSPSHSLVKISSGSGQARLFCVPGTMGNVFVDLGDLAGFLEPEYTVYGFQDSHRNPMRIEKLSSKYLQEMISVDREGPYYLMGICSGAVVAFEMAQQLRAMGKMVAFLAMVEPSPPRDNPLKSYIDFSSQVIRRAVSERGRHSEDLARLNRQERKLYFLMRLRYYAVHLAVRRYRPRAYPGTVHLYLTNESFEDKEAHRMDWSAYCQQGAAAREIRGTHDSITGNYRTPISVEGMSSLASKVRADIATGREQQ
jgi:oxalate---CoA ligase